MTDAVFTACAHPLRVAERCYGRPTKRKREAGGLPLHAAGVRPDAMSLGA